MPTPEHDPEGWSAHRIHVTKGLDELKEEVKEQGKELIGIKLKMAGMTIFTGGSAGAIVASVVELIKYLIEKKP